MQLVPAPGVQSRAEPAMRQSGEQGFSESGGEALTQLQAMIANSPRQLAQRKAAQIMNAPPRQVAQREAVPNPNRTGMPDQLKSGIESLSGMSMDAVKVHYNSDKPAQLNAHAYAQGSDIHVAPGQEQHLPHEAWHVVQQAQGRVQATRQMKAGVAVNDDAGLEHEADVMGARAMATGAAPAAAPTLAAQLPAAAGGVAQAYNMTYGGLNNGSGTDMHVYIDGKNDPDLGKGSSPSTTPHWWPQAGTPEREYLRQYAVQGHLLNEHLGGPGHTMQNLTPITKSTNSTHFKKIEDIVKKGVAADYGVEYRVRATYGAGPPLGDFGSNPPPALAGLLPNFATEIGADYDFYDRQTKQKVDGAIGELLIKNEGKHKKGTF
jgi:hypothetical protein